ncbi:uncharacterized protein C8Q71DRAFT_728095 [Rhodofomes roseus]|uniref:Pyridoxamine 5'-phosphate oxidase Alr4036 family FMN-binding domain-containing protein n=1 Tax=Rhodofomes roseus TaxID=34475 RepID=A0ABQ8JYY7_9APHY|nr:uncharacterized protein C8Q71DRAFT_728095 [Rhodofomes roseus]KAH9829506.1 hypothetical protein C8Q71DRAFT_728095 [Rhodofomes roseus]
MVSAPRWLAALTTALGLPENKGQIMYQLASVDANGNPHVRTIGHRGFIEPEGSPNLPLLMCATDIRTPKVTQILTNPHVELIWWLSGSMEQFRLTGVVRLVPPPDAQLPDLPVQSTEASLAFQKMDAQGFEWEKKRVETYDVQPPFLRAGFARPPPGAIIENYDVGKSWPGIVPRAEDAQNEEEKQAYERGLRTFALMFFDPVEVDWVQLKERPNRRTKFIRKGEEWSEYIAVP